ncbi:MAG: ATP-binding protein [Thermodesulfobacteriota bacterium]|nr:ATP-binding protein [Thermodesulfobacteriota bacterium]
MVSIEDIVRYENEHTGLDFKAVQYKKDQYEELIKDIMAIANADFNNERYIIVGVKHCPDGSRQYLPIDRTEFVDSATYQQIIRENIEPDINFDYVPYEFEGKLLGCFKIYAREEDQPYMMKKDYNKLKKGDSFIRKGTYQPKMERRDYERIFEKRKKADIFDGCVELGFTGTDYEREITLTINGGKRLPSQRAAEKIEKILEEKKQEERIVQEKLNTTTSDHLSSLTNVFSRIALQNQIQMAQLPRLSSDLSPRPYDQRSIEELEQDLKEVQETYKEDDIYEFFEINAHTINITILNNGRAYIEDASVKLEIKKIDGLIIPEKICPKPNHGLLPQIDFPYETWNYPDIQSDDVLVSISQKIGNIRHYIPTEAFKTPIRMVLLKNLAGETIEILCKIFGKNLVRPIERVLRIKAISINEEGKER